MAFHPKVQEMGCTGDARVVVADRLFEPPLEFVVGKLHQGGDHKPEVVFDSKLVLGSGRNDPGVDDGPLTIQLIAVIEKAPGGLTRPMTGSGGNRPNPIRGGGWLIGIDQLESCGEGMNELHRPDLDAPKGIAGAAGDPGAHGGGTSGRMELFEVEVVAGHRTYLIGPPPDPPGGQSIPPLDVLLGAIR